MFHLLIKANGESVTLEIFFAPWPMVQLCGIKRQFFGNYCARLACKLRSLGCVWVT